MRQRVPKFQLLYIALKESTQDARDYNEKKEIKMLERKVARRKWKDSDTNSGEGREAGKQGSREVGK